MCSCLFARVALRGCERAFLVGGGCGGFGDGIFGGRDVNLGRVKCCVYAGCLWLTSCSERRRGGKVFGGRNKVGVVGVKWVGG